MHFLQKTVRIDYVSLPVEVPLDVPDLVHLVAQLGSELDPKCDTKIKMPYLTGIQWWWSQVSGTQIDFFSCQDAPSVKKNLFWAPPPPRDPRVGVQTSLVGVFL